MRLFTTSIKAIDKADGRLKTWCGPNIPAISFSDAREYCENNGLGYCEVDGILICEIDEATGERIDYDTTELN